MTLSETELMMALARSGAAIEIVRIQAEIDRILQVFPDLAGETRQPLPFRFQQARRGRRRRAGSALR